MKKRMILVTFILTISLILPQLTIANQEINPYYKISKAEPTRTFYITYQNGRSHYRTFESYNKESKYYNPKKTNSEAKGIYRDSFDTFHKSNNIQTNPRPKRLAPCPEGWTCTKHSSS